MALIHKQFQSNKFLIFHIKDIALLKLQPIHINLKESVLSNIFQENIKIIILKHQKRRKRLHKNFGICNDVIMYRRTYTQRTKQRQFTDKPLQEERLFSTIGR